MKRRNSMAHILFIDDEAGGRQVACFNLRKAGYEVDEAENGTQGLARFDPAEHDLVITDIRMPGLDGIELTKKVHERAPNTPVLVITAFGTIETAVKAMQAGAHNFVLKPFDREQLLLACSKALEKRALKLENQKLRRQLRGIERPIIAESSAMKSVLDIVDRVAGSQATVLISGPSGAGKELIARRLHARSPRADAPFVTLNCAAMPAELIEAELFGHAKGAFTGATQARQGRFRQADGGTLFLDEIGELPPSAQAKLLRVLQEGIVDVVGADKPEQVDVRIVTATNRQLKLEIQEGRFREDLYFRINVVEIKVPPLSQRPGDIEPLLRAFVKELRPDEPCEISADVVGAIKKRSWPGNVRELRNAVERMAILSPPGSLDPAYLPDATATAGVETGDPLSALLRLPNEGLSLLDVEKQLIETAIERCNGNVSEAARFLQVPRHFLIYRIEKYGIQRGTTR